MEHIAGPNLATYMFCTPPLERGKNRAAALTTPSDAGSGGRRPARDGSRARAAGRRSDGADSKGSTWPEVPPSTVARFEVVRRTRGTRTALDSPLSAVRERRAAREIEIFDSFTFGAAVSIQ